MSEKNKNTSFLNGAFILAAAGILCKIIGALYKIPLRSMIGAQAMGVYTTVYPIYNFLLVFSTAGIPTAISKLVAEKRNSGSHTEAHRVFLTSLRVLLIIGLITTTVMLAFSNNIAAAMQIRFEDGTVAWQPVAAIALSLLFVSLLSAYRGYFQGMQNMTPTAVNQVVEQIVKLVAGFFFAKMFYDRWGYVMGAAGALLGITISEFAAFVVIFFTYQKKKPTILSRVDLAEPAQGKYVRMLLAIAIPITLGSAAKSLVDSIDSLMIKNILYNDLHFNSGYIDTIYGFLKNDCGTLINMPSVLYVALSMAVVPAISGAIKSSRRETSSITRTSLKLALIIGLPCTIGFLTMAREILYLLYGYKTETYSDGTVFDSSSQIQAAGTFLMILSFGVLLLAIIQIASAILQGAGKVIYPVVNLAIGMAVKILINFIFVPRAEVNIYAVPVGTVTCYAIAALLDVICVFKVTKVRPDFVNGILRPIGAAALMAAAILFVKYPFMNVLSRDNTRGHIATAIIICIAALVYFMGLIVFNVLDENDLALMPGGKKIKSVLRKLHVNIRQGE